MSNIYTEDSVMRGFTYNDAILILQNINPERGDVWEIMKKEIRKWANDNLSDAIDELEQHKGDILEEAFPGERKPLVNHPCFTDAKIECMANDIYQFLLSHEMWIDVCIYYNGKRMRTVYQNNGYECLIEGDMDPRDYFEYVAEPHILSMSFEGIFYETLNGYRGGHSVRIEKEFCDLLNKHGCYYELGDAWNLTCCTL